MTSATALATKAHQLLSKGDVGEAVFAANCVEEVVKVPSLTKQELGVLSVLFLKILDRIFGEDVTSPPETTASSASAAATATSSWVKGSPGGWMRALGLQNSTYGDISNLPHSGVKLLKHFLPGQPIFGLLQEISSEFAVTLLPPKLQMLLSNHYLYRVVSSPSHNRILQLLHYPVSFDRNNVVKLDATEYFIFCLTRFPALYNHLSPFANFMSPGGQSSSMLNNSTSCPYFGPPSVVLRSRGIYAWTGTLPYLAVLLAYLREFFPHMRTSEISSNASQQSMVIQQSKTKELFLRIAVEYWANSAYVVHVEFNQLSAYRRQLYTTSPLLVAGQCLDGDLPRGHPPLHEAILLNGYGSVKFTLAGCQGLYMMLFSVLSDPQLRNQLLSADVSQSSADSSAGILLQILQCPLFDMIRCVFQKGEETAVDRELVRLTTQLWLLYLQPWAINLSLGTVDFSRTYSRTWRVYLAHNLHFYTTLTSSFLRMYSKINDYEDMSTLAMLSDVLSLLTQSDLHHDIMELHKELASMPLRSTREPSNLQTPFRSPSRPSGALGLSEVESVETCALREHHLRLFPDPSVHALPQGGLILPQEASLEQCATVSQSLKNLQLSSSQDAMGLSERVLQALFNKVSQYIGLSTARELSPIARTASLCLRQLHEWSPELATYIQKLRANQSELYSEGAEPVEKWRDAKTSRLTAEGVAALRDSRMRCDPRDLNFRVDALDAPACSFEHPAVLRFLVRLSKTLNARFSLPRKQETLMLTWTEVFRGANGVQDAALALRDSGRFNLRMLAHYRAVGFILILLGHFFWHIHPLVAVIVAVYAARLIYVGGFPVHIEPF